MIDLSSPDQWPSEFVGVVAHVADEARKRGAPGEGVLGVDLPHRLGPAFSEHAERLLRRACRDDLVLAYHATRLLPHELADIRRDGMSTLSRDLVDLKLLRAREHYPELLSDEDVELLRRAGPLTWQESHRLGLLWVATPFAVFAPDGPGGFDDFVGTWGGEAIGWTADAEEEVRPAADVVARLTAVSSPAVIELAVTTDQVPDDRPIWPVAVGQLLGLRMSVVEWPLTSAVPGSRVVDVMLPGNARWPATLPMT